MSLAPARPRHPHLLESPAGLRRAPSGLWIGRGHALVEKFWADDDVDRATPYDVVEAENALLTAGATHVLNRLCGVTATALDATNARLAVGNGTTAVAVGQTDLTGASKTRKAPAAAPVISGNSMQLSTTFLAAEANHTWSEAGLSIGDAGTLLNRFLQAFGTKTSALQWTLTVTITLGA